MRARAEQARGVGFTSTALVGLLLLFAACVAVAEEPSGPAATGKRLFTDQGCYGCHTIGKFGTPIATDLSRAGTRYDMGYLMRWLRDPSAQRPTAHMPKLAMSEEDAQALAAYLASLR